MMIMNRLHQTIMTVVLLLGFLMNVQAQVILDNRPLVKVRGEGVVKVLPNLALIRVKVAYNLAGQNPAAINPAQLFLTQNNNIRFLALPDSLVLNTAIVYKSDTSGQRFEKEYIIHINDLKRVPELIVELLRRGFDDIELTYRLINISEVKDMARAKAMKQAKEEADKLVKPLGQTIGKVHQVEELVTQVDSYYDQSHFYRVSNLAEEVYVSNPGYITVYALVLVSFDLGK